jgi:hypothetical protein
MSQPLIIIVQKDEITMMSLHTLASGFAYALNSKNPNNRILQYITSSAHFRRK